MGLAVLTLATAAYLPSPAARAGVPSLREQAEKSGILIGSGSINPNYLDEPAFANTLASQFNSLSPENELKWSNVEPQRGVFNLAPIDKLVKFARQHRMVVKGHGLVSGGFNPGWLTQITDPDELRTVTLNHFKTVMDSYGPIMDRFDVVTEPLSTFGGTGLAQDYWYNTLGPDYIAQLFEIAHQARPKAKLFINESLVESYPAKEKELYALVSDLVARGVPISGVGLEMHETLVPPPPGAITNIVNEYKALGLDVSFTETEAHTYDNVTQAEIYGDIFAEALAAGVTDFSFWGFTDKYIWTWLPASKPHIFDKDYNPKPAFYAILNAITNHPCWMAAQPACWASASAGDAVISGSDPVETPAPSDVRPPDNL